jgi:hypothetical protein
MQLGVINALINSRTPMQNGFAGFIPDLSNQLPLFRYRGRRRGNCLYS